MVPFVFLKTPIEEPEGSHVCEERENIQVLAPALRGHLPCVDVEILDVGKCGLGLLLQHVPRCPNKIGRFECFGMDFSHLARAEVKLSENAALRIGAPLFRHQGDVFESRVVIGGANFVKYDFESVLWQRWGDCHRRRKAERGVGSGCSGEYGRVRRVPHSDGEL